MAEELSVTPSPSAASIDTSVRWAKDQELLKETGSLITDSRGIHAHAAKDVLAPWAFSQLDELLGIRNTHRSWAQFGSPEGYESHRGQLFTSLIAPSLGSEEALDKIIERLGTAGPEDSEGSTLKKMLQEILVLNKNSNSIRGFCGQYHKG